MNPIDSWRFSTLCWLVDCMLEGMKYPYMEEASLTDRIAALGVIRAEIKKRLNATT